MDDDTPRLYIAADISGLTTRYIALEHMHPGADAWVPEAGWQPTETAPMWQEVGEATPCLLWARGQGMHTGVAATRKDGTPFAAVPGFHGFTWTHWMPLPPAPDDDAVADESGEG